jgi:iron complex outermembrane receptor protein
MNVDRSAERPAVWLRVGGLPSSLAALALVSPVPAAAQADPTPDSASAETVIESVVVTARRRQERAQDVPLAVAVLDAASLAATGTFNVGLLTRSQPSLQFYSSNPRNTAVNIRGLGAPFGLTNDGIEQGVGLYVDQVYFARIASATFDFLDVEQVEVLRGPQGTLYGKNTTAGAISIRSRAPSFTPEATAELSVGDLDFVQAKASVSGPLVEERLAVRLGGSYTDRRGTIRNVTTGEYINEQDNLGGKVQFLFRASDDLDLTLSGDYSRQDPLCCAQLYVRAGSTQRPLNRQFAALAAASGDYAPPSLDPFDRVTDLDAPIAAGNTLGGASLLAEWRIGDGALTSVSAWRTWRWAPANDRDFTGLPITTLSQNPSRQDQWSQEVRYSGSLDRFDYVLGIYGFHQEIDTTGAQAQGPLASRWLLSGANAANPAILDGLRSENDIGLANTSAAAFGQLSWRVTDRWRIQPGLRFNYDEKEGRYIATVTNATGTALTPPQLGALAPQRYAPRFDDTNVSGDFTSSFEFTPDVLGYATYARSFKSGGINLSGLPLDANNQPITAVETVAPERVNHGEIGLKSQLRNGTITANVTAFWTEIDDYQATVTNSQANVIRGYLANADEVRVRGVEVELAARPTDRLSAWLNATYIDHEYVRFPDAPCPPELAGGPVATAANPASPPGTPGGFSPPFCDVSGQWLPGISNTSLTYGLDYAWPASLAAAGGEAYVGVDGSYRSKFSSNPSRSAYTDIEGYALTNVHVGYRSDDGWDLKAWVRNAFDEEYFEFLATQSGNTGLVVGLPGDPRTYGVTLRVAF